MEFLLFADCCPAEGTGAAEVGSSLQMADINAMALELKNMILFESVFVKKRLESEIVVVLDVGTRSKSRNRNGL